MEEVNIGQEEKIQLVEESTPEKESLQTYNRNCRQVYHTYLLRNLFLFNITDYISFDCI